MSLLLTGKQSILRLKVIWVLDITMIFQILTVLFNFRQGL